MHEMTPSSALPVKQVELFPELPAQLAAAASPRKSMVRFDSQRAASMVPDKTTDAFKTISEVAAILALPQYVLRFWESKFKQIKPLKLRGGRRYYRPEDIETLETIKHLLYKEGYTIKGARQAFEEIRKTEKHSKPVRRKNKKPAPLLQPQHPPRVSQTAMQADGEVIKKMRRREELAAIQAELMALKQEMVAG